MKNPTDPHTLAEHLRQNFPLADAGLKRAFLKGQMLTFNRGMGSKAYRKAATLCHPLTPYKFQLPGMVARTPKNRVAFEPHADLIKRAFNRLQNRP